MMLAMVGAPLGCARTMSAIREEVRMRPVVCTYGRDRRSQSAASRRALKQSFVDLAHAFAHAFERLRQGRFPPPAKGERATGRNRRKRTHVQEPMTVFDRKCKAWQQGDANATGRHLNQGRKAGGAVARLVRARARTEREYLFAKAVTIVEQQHLLAFEILR